MDQVILYWMLIGSENLHQNFQLSILTNSRENSFFPIVFNTDWWRVCQTDKMNYGVDLLPRKLAYRCASGIIVWYNRDCCLLEEGAGVSSFRCGTPSWIETRTFRFFGFNFFSSKNAAKSRHKTSILLLIIRIWLICFK